MADRKQIGPKRPIPLGGYDLLRKNLKSGFADGFPVKEYPSPDNRSNINRGRITTRKDDKVKDVSIGLQDHDEAIMYYFNQIIKPSVIINGNRTNVPVVYGSPERWKGVQKDGYYRDKEGKIQVPLIMFKRDSVEKRRDLGNKLDGNNPQLHYVFQEKYTKRNQYDNFSVLQNRMPQKEFHAIVVPDFIKLVYTCTIWTDYVAQMNKLIESINYTSDSYWGDPEKFKFNAKIDTYNNTTEVAQGDNRIVKTNFGLTLQGYLVPDSINKELEKKPQKFFSKSTVVFKGELSVLPTGAPKTREEIRGGDEVDNYNSGADVVDESAAQTTLEGVGFSLLGGAGSDALENVIGGDDTSDSGGSYVIEDEAVVGSDVTLTFSFTIAVSVTPGGELLPITNSEDMVVLKFIDGTDFVAILNALGTDVNGTNANIGDQATYNGTTYEYLGFGFVPLIQEVGAVSDIVTIQYPQVTDYKVIVAPSDNLSAFSYLTNMKDVLTYYLLSLNNQYFNSDFSIESSTNTTTFNYDYIITAASDPYEMIPAWIMNSTFEGYLAAGTFEQTADNNGVAILGSFTP